MKFSILMPVYNAEKYLCSSVQSVLDQTYKNFELVLVDDGSTDNSPKLCDKLSNDYPGIVKVVHQQNQGQLLTRCNAIKESTGDYCLFLDADDFIVPDALQILSDYISEYGEPDIVIYSFYYEHIDGKLEESKPLFDDDTHFENDDKKYLYKAFFTSTKLNNVWTKAVKRSVFDGDYPEFQKYSKLRCSEDRLHSMAMVSNAERILYITKPLYKYKLVEGSVTRQFSISAVQRFNTRVLYEQELKYIHDWNLALPEYHQRLDASFINQTLYVLDLFYNKVCSSNKTRLLHYDWTSFVPDNMLDNYTDNPYLNNTQKKLWKLIIEKKYSQLRFCFFKKKLFKTIRSIKRKILK